MAHTMSDNPNEPVCKRTPCKIRSSRELAFLETWKSKLILKDFYLGWNKDAGADHISDNETDSMEEGNLLLQLQAAALRRGGCLSDHREGNAVWRPNSEDNNDDRDERFKNKHAEQVTQEGMDLDHMVEE